MLFIILFCSLYETLCYKSKGNRKRKWNSPGNLLQRQVCGTTARKRGFQVLDDWDRKQSRQRKEPLKVTMHLWKINGGGHMKEQKCWQNFKHLTISVNLGGVMEGHILGAPLAKDRKWGWHRWRGDTYPCQKTVEWARTCPQTNLYYMLVTKILVVSLSLSLDSGWISDDFYFLCYTFKNFSKWAFITCIISK